MECRTRDYEIERLRTNNLQTTEVSNHPLKTLLTTVKHNKAPLVSNPLITNGADEGATNTNKINLLPSHNGSQMSSNLLSSTKDPLSSFEDPLSMFQADDVHSKPTSSMTHRREEGKNKVVKGYT